MQFGGCYLSDQRSNSPNPNSVLYDEVNSVEDIDKLAETSDTVNGDDTDKNPGFIHSVRG
jgi:hypothetical protein